MHAAWKFSDKNLIRRPINKICIIQRRRNTLSNNISYVCWLKRESSISVIEGLLPSEPYKTAPNISFKHISNVYNQYLFAWYKYEEADHELSEGQRATFKLFSTVFVVDRPSCAQLVDVNAANMVTDELVVHAGGMELADEFGNGFLEAI